MALTRRKKTKAATKPGTRTGDKPTATYDGETPSGEVYRDDMILVAIDDAPDSEYFPKVNRRAVPPETYYAYNVKAKRCEYMLSFDEAGVGIAWDVDYSGRYFTRTTIPLRCPRFVEFSYDTSLALANGEHWSRSHPSYYGSLSSRLNVPDAQPDHRLAPRAKRPLQRRTGPENRVLPQPTPAKGKPLRRKTLPAAPEKRSGLLTDKGLDRGALDKAAESFSDKLASDLAKGLAKSKPLRKRKLVRR